MVDKAQSTNPILRVVPQPRKHKARNKAFQKGVESAAAIQTGKNRAAF
jgi:hypothetical protein